MSEPNEAVTTAPTMGDVVERLSKHFTPAPAQVENSSETKAEEAKVEEPVTEEAKPEEPAKGEDVEKAESEKDAEAEQSDESDEEGKEEEILDYPSEEELKAAWPRSVPLHAIKQAAGWANEAKEGKEAVESIGGKHFLPAMAKMATALQDEDAPPEAFQPFFEGIMDAAGDNAFLKVLGQSMYMGFVQAPQWEANPATKDFGKELSTKVDTALQLRFGVDAETIISLADWQSIGAIDGLSTLLEGEYLDADKEWDVDAFYDASKKLYDDLRAIQHNPKLKAQTLENLELKRQLEERKAEVKVPNSEIESSFTDYIGTVVDNVLPKVIFSTSPLVELETDTDEMKERKADFRDDITAKVKQALEGSRKTLLEGYRQGKQNTAVFQTALTKALDEAIRKTDGSRKTKEQTIKDLYGKTRNAKLLAKSESIKEEQTEAPLPPTQTTRFEPADRPRTVMDVANRLTQSIAARDANER